MWRNLGSIPGLGRSPGDGNGNPLQYSCLENPMDRGAWWATVRGVAKSQTQLSEKHFHFHVWQWYKRLESYQISWYSGDSGEAEGRVVINSSKKWEGLLPFKNESPYHHPNKKESKCLLKGPRLPEKASGGHCSWQEGTGHSVEKLHQAFLAGGRFRKSSFSTKLSPAPVLGYVEGEEEKGKDSIT